MVKICITGCLHGELDKVYADIAALEQTNDFKTDLVLCCGDFQAVRNPADLDSMSIPPKYYSMGDFWRYYSEEKEAPILTIFIGGNHEASSYLQELPYGGWVAPNIWYMGYSGVVQFRGLRIAGLSGIYKQHDYTMNHYEHSPYSEASKRSVYHLRNIDVFRLGQIRRRLDAVLSHDWPRGIYHYGDTRQLLRAKPFFRDEIATESLGSPPAEQLLCRLRPRYWFSAHMHCKFAACVEHYDQEPPRKDAAAAAAQITKFLALDKALNKRAYLQFVDIDPVAPSGHGDDPVIVSDPTSDGLYLDPEWLGILQSTNHLMSIHQVPCILPEPTSKSRFDFSVTPEEFKKVNETFDQQFSIPQNFVQTAPAHKPQSDSKTSKSSLIQLAKSQAANQPILSNPQTELLCAMLELINPNAVHAGRESYSYADLCSRLVVQKDQEEDELDDDDNDSSCNEEAHEQPSASVTDEAVTTEYDPLNSDSLLISSSKNPEEVCLSSDSSSSDDDTGGGGRGREAVDGDALVFTSGSPQSDTDEIEKDQQQFACNVGVVDRVESESNNEYEPSQLPCTITLSENPEEIPLDVESDNEDVV